MDQKDLLEKGMATHASILAWRTPRTEELGGLESIGLQSQTLLSELNNTNLIFISESQKADYLRTP